MARAVSTLAALPRLDPEFLHLLAGFLPCPPVPRPPSLAAWSPSVPWFHLTPVSMAFGVTHPPSLGTPGQTVGNP